MINGSIASILEVGTGFHPDLTGKENIYMNGTLLGMKKVDINRCLDEIIDFSGVSDFIDEPVKNYSTGMKVRLAFSVAAHLQTDILLMDEVLAVGDIAFQQKCIGKIGEVNKNGKSVIFVSHNTSAINSLCNKVLYLKNGPNSVQQINYMK
jgi:lipopolysaccharide transport system ATP-binding protein